jgi:hypothetical protein
LSADGSEEGRFTIAVVRPGYAGVPVTLTIADRLISARHARFVGRRAELALFRAALDAAEPRFAVLFVHGDGGVGKTALLHAFRDLAAQAGVPAVLVDGRDREPTPAGFGEALGSSGEHGREHDRSVLLIDTYEALDVIDSWLRRTLLPGLPARTIVVIASRNPPARGWRADPGWADLLVELPLRNLAAADAHQYLAAAGVASWLHDEIVAITNGHPLALSLVVEVLAQSAGDADMSAFHRPDVVRRLLEQFVEDLPTPDHRVALDTCALARATTHRHLQATVGRDDVAELFDWLRQLSFVADSPHGLVPHDLARHVLSSDVRWRDPDRYRSLMLTLLRVTGDEMRASAGGHPAHRSLIDLVFSPDARLSQYWDHGRLSEMKPQVLAPEDHDLVVCMIHDTDAPSNGALARHWLAAQPDAFRVSRDASGTLESVVCWLDLTRASADDIAADPVTRAAWDHVRRRGGPGPGDMVTIARFLSPADDEAQRRTLTALGSYEWLRLAIGHPERTWDFFAIGDPDWWRPLFTSGDYEEIPGGVVDLGDCRRSLFAHDWRTWPELLSRILDERDWRVLPLPQPAPAPLARPEHDAAVRQALRDLHNPAALARNPLAGGDGEQLADRLRDAAASLRWHPRDEKLFRALDRTYFRPAASQEAAAELLGLPSSTYRRHLSQGITRLADLLAEGGGGG